MTQLVVEKIALLHVKLSIKLVIKTSWFVMKRPFVNCFISKIAMKTNI